MAIITHDTTIPISAPALTHGFPFLYISRMRNRSLDRYYIIPHFTQPPLGR
jgi:hypothetical protein